MIFSKQKNLELRSQKCKLRGFAALLESGAQLIHGVVKRLGGYSNLHLRCSRHSICPFFLACMREVFSCIGLKHPGFKIAPF